MVKAETITGAAIGLGSVAANVASVATGMPTGSMGAQYWQSTRAMTSTVGVFGILSLLLLGGIGVAIVNKNHEDRRLQNRRSVMAKRKRRLRQRELERQLGGHPQAYCHSPVYPQAYSRPQAYNQQAYAQAYQRANVQPYRYAPAPANVAPVNVVYYYPQQ